MSELNVLIAPTLDLSLMKTFWSVRGQVAHRTSTGNKKIGQKIYELEITDLSDRNFEGAAFMQLFKQMLRRSINLSLRAPVGGDYRFGPGDMFGYFVNNELAYCDSLRLSGIANPVIAGASYDLTTAKERNRPPENLQELKAGQTSGGLPTTFAFAAITSSHEGFSGNDLYADLFKSLRENQETISAWLNGNSNFGVGLDRFWDTVGSEERRLADIHCPVIPYDGQDLG